MKTKLLFAAVIALSLPAVAQNDPQRTPIVERMNSTPMFRVIVISRSVQAVNYEHRSGSFEAGLRGHGPDALRKW